MKKNVFIASLAFALFFSCNCSFASHDIENLSAKEAIQKLKQGNKRFISNKAQHPDESKERKKEMLKGQHPFVVILSCSDSRVPPELIFDQGLGDIFEIRNAGNVLNEHVIGSIEYAVMHCGVKLIVIMGHQDCGAIAATLSGVSETKYIQALEDSIKPAIEDCKCKGLEINSDNVVKAHVMQDIKELLEQDIDLVKYMDKHNVKIVPAYYHLDSGRVDFMKLDK
ncbi:MAG: carbonic anhydrase [Candidatus Gastranaerophilales bacterium]|nr:carbonic anhydrase [Candidatus Gastranaerophilales bacterium]